MNEETGFVAAVLRDLATSTAVILAAWGALGGATNALTTRVRLRDAGLHEAEIARLHAPVGSIPSTRDPRSLAVSVLAEVVSASLHLTAPPLSRG